MYRIFYKIKGSDDLLCWVQYDFDLIKLAYKMMLQDPLTIIVKFEFFRQELRL